MPQIVRGYAPGRFGQLHYRIAVCDAPDALPPLLCLHQTPSNSRDWLPVMEPLSAWRTVIAVDTPGYGMSDAPPEPVTIEDFAQIMAQFMTGMAEQGLVAPGPFDVMGFHTGSIIATQLARSLPERVRRVVVFGLAAYSAEVREVKLANLLTAFPPPGPDLTHVEKLWAIIGQLSDPRMSYEERHVSMAECLRLGARMPWGYISVYRFDFVGAMAQVTQPVLVMNPQDDLWEQTLATSHIFRNSRRVDMPGVAHGVLRLENARVVEEISAFLE
jgi:pimeloyl-ACP methyl ester carboxylesterase